MLFKRFVLANPNLYLFDEKRLFRTNSKNGTFYDSLQKDPDEFEKTFVLFRITCECICPKIECSGKGIPFSVERKGFTFVFTTQVNESRYISRYIFYSRATQITLFLVSLYWYLVSFIIYCGSDTKYRLPAEKDLPKNVGEYSNNSKVALLASSLLN